MHDSVTLGDIAVEHVSVGALACTCTIVADRTSGEAVVVDGGADVDVIVARLERLGVRATHLIHTHAHIDHIGALADLRDRTGGRGLLHEADVPLYAMLAEQARWLGQAAPRASTLDGYLCDGDAVRAGRATLGALHTPGSTSFSLELGTRTILLTGDTLFAGSVGRWDLGGTSLEAIVASVREKLFVFADDTIVVPGHGPITTVGAEKRANPYFS